MFYLIFVALPGFYAKGILQPSQRKPRHDGPQPKGSHAKALKKSTRQRSREQSSPERISFSSSNGCGSSWLFISVLQWFVTNVLWTNNMFSPNFIYSPLIRAELLNNSTPETNWDNVVPRLGQSNMLRLHFLADGDDLPIHLPRIL